MLTFYRYRYADILVEIYIHYTGTDIRTLYRFTYTDIIQVQIYRPPIGTDVQKL